MAVAMTWGSGGLHDDRVLAVDVLLAVIDDGDNDKLTGSSSRDLFYDGAGDHLTDLGANDTLIP